MIVLCGGVLEAILTDLLKADSARAAAAQKAPKAHKGDVARWDLKDLIDVAVELTMVGQGTQKLSHPVREYRNLVHPSYEMRNGLAFGPEEARIALEIVNMLHRDKTKSP